MPTPPKTSRWTAAVSAAVLDLVLPADCAACGGERGPLCPTCRQALPDRGGPARPAGALPGLPAVAAAGPYEGVLRAALLAHKDGATGLAGVLGAVLATAVTAAVGPGVPVVLVPAPSSRRAVRARGHDHALRLAQHAAADLRGCGVRAEVVPVLRQRRRVEDQGSLTARGRAANLRGALAARRAGRIGSAVRSGAALVLVDDVCASGATLAECGFVLGRAGHVPEAAAVVAATVRRSEPGPARAGVAPRPLCPAPLPSSAGED